MNEKDNPDESNDGVVFYSQKSDTATGIHHARTWELLGNQNP